MSLLTFVILKNSHSWYGIYYIFLKKRLAINLKGFQNQIGNSVEIMKKQLSSKTTFRDFFQTFCSNIEVETVSETLQLQKTTMQVEFARVCGEFEQKTVSRNNHSQNILDKLQFSCEIAHYGKSSISIFQEIFVSTDKLIFSGGSLSTSK